jgi:hypothetical protein
MMLAYFPPKSVLSEALGLDLLDEEPMTRTSVSVTVIRLFIKSVLVGAPFDEAYYLRHNPDIEVAWKAGMIADLHQHFIETGYFEGRKAWQMEVNEKWYLSRYKDVALAVREGQVTSAQQHYELVGESEWRAPNEAAGALMQEWRLAFAGLAR